MKENKAMVKTPINWVVNKSRPPPKNNPPSMAKTPTASVPNSPLTPWTAIAPTGSSIWSTLSKTTERSREMEYD